MSFGLLLVNVVLVFNKGVKLGGFYYDMGEGSVLCYYWEGGGDFVWEFGSGYFGCWVEDGGFDVDKFVI